VKKKILNKKEILILKTSIRIDEIKKISVIFIRNFLYHLKYIKKHSISINFLRHLETILPSRIFIGQKINPLLKQSNKVNKYSLGDESVINNKIIYTSPLLRSQNTSSVLFPGHKYQVLKLVNEIDYGLVEGLDFVQLKKYFYKLYIKKKNGKKFKYPRGESYNDVRKRIFLLIKKFSYDKKNTIIITHNVFIRVLLGMFLKVKDSELHHISINYGQNFHFILYNNRLYPNFPRSYLLNLFSKNYVNS
jgi:broad specificity phosphatase PhoE